MELGVFAGQRITKRHGGLMFDFSAIAKGYAVGPPTKATAATCAEADALASSRLVKSAAMRERP